MSLMNVLPKLDLPILVIASRYDPASMIYEAEFNLTRGDLSKGGAAALLAIHERGSDSLWSHLILQVGVIRMLLLSLCPLPLHQPGSQALALHH